MDPRILRDAAGMSDGAVPPSPRALLEELEVAEAERDRYVKKASKTKEQVATAENERRAAQAEWDRLVHDRNAAATAILCGESDGTLYDDICAAMTACQKYIDICVQGRAGLEARALCRSCWSWALAGQHLQRYASLTRLIREARA